ncbi:MAG: hypothetical protein HJHJAOHD_02682 [Flavobacteriales bacterium]|nr:hypothetical protein [Flavobacteriales bacterium]
MRLLAVHQNKDTMQKVSSLIILFFLSITLFSQEKYTVKNEIDGILYKIEFQKHIVQNQKFWGEYFPFNQKIELGEISISKPVKIPFTEVLLDKSNYKFSILAKEHSDWTLFFTDENSKEITYQIAPFTLFNTSSNTLLFYIEEPEPVNGMAFIQLVGNDTQIGFYLEPVK